jgi:hypothetical protein
MIALPRRREPSLDPIEQVPAAPQPAAASGGGGDLSISPGHKEGRGIAV